MLTHTLAQLAGTVVTQLPPNPAPVAPPGGAADKITQVIGIVKWVAGIALIAGFFAGVAVFTGGRIIDHRRVGAVGTGMMLASLGGALLYAAGYALLVSFAG